MDAPEAGRKSVLIVDDDDLNRKLFAVILVAEGYRVLQAADGQGGFDLAAEHHPDLIIMDVGLPDISGLDVTRKLKADSGTSDIPIIVATAFLIDRQELWASGCDAVITKPFKKSDLLKAVEFFMLPAAQPSTLAPAPGAAS